MRDHAGPSALQVLTRLGASRCSSVATLLTCRMRAQLFLLRKEGARGYTEVLDFVNSLSGTVYNPSTSPSEQQSTDRGPKASRVLAQIMFHVSLEHSQKVFRTLDSNLILKVYNTTAGGYLAKSYPPRRISQLPDPAGRMQRLGTLFWFVMLKRGSHNLEIRAKGNEGDKLLLKDILPAYHE